jgi:hypothetical protein
MIDSVTFGAQTNDVAQGRFPDGASSIYYLTTPTPTNSNIYVAPNTAPGLGVIGNYTNYPGTVVSFTATASDPDVPQQTLTFSLDSGAPAGALVNSVSGQFTWTIPGNMPASTNNITLRVTDNGTPARSSAQTFSVVVLVPLRVGSFQSSGPGQFTLGWPSVAGKHYQVQFKPALNAPNWTDLGGPITATGSTTSINDTPGAATQRFYRILVLD